MLGLMHERQMGQVAPLSFRLLHLVGFALTLPVFAMARLIPGRRGQRPDENVFAETNRSVLTALGIAFMA